MQHTDIPVDSPCPTLQEPATIFPPSPPSQPRLQRPRLVNDPQWTPALRYKVESLDHWLDLNA
jgi:hypothetical protein